MLLRVALAFGACIWVGVTHRAKAAERVDVPISQMTLPNGDVRYYVPVSIGGKEPIKAMLDTGSTGLRVLKSAVRSDQYRDTGARGQYRFTNGARFEGPLVQATVGVGTLATEYPIAVHVIDHVECVERRPHCPVSRVAFKDFRMAGGGVPGQGFDAIIGTSMRKPMRQPNADNPLTAMGDDSWIVVLPLPGSDQPGHLIINPTAEDRDGFTTIKLRPQPGGMRGGGRGWGGPGFGGPGIGGPGGPEEPDDADREGPDGARMSNGGAGDGSDKPGWRDAGLEGCIIDDAAKKRLCGRTLLDSGAVGFSVDSNDSSGRNQWSGGTRATFEIDGGDKPIKFSFMTGKGASTEVKVHPARHPNLLRISAGNQPYFAYSVLYDAKVGSMGFKPR